ncbi:MAG: hypothetical protein B6241_09005 [Spirochaetaceae bacterium 4572_59]|nr:MAG: hypothetical protein B6241_09005 [Spirochaetaceae bacterium 4572_59]
MSMGKGKVKFLILLLVFSLSLLFAESPVVLNAGGNDALDEGDYYSALDYYKQALRLNSSYVDALIGISKAYFLLQEYHEALDYSEKARIGASRRIEILNLQGRIYLGLGELENAEDMFNQVLGIEPNNINAAYGKAEIAVFRGNFREGSALFEKSLNVNPDSRRALLSLVALSDQLKLPDKAEHYMMTAIKLFPQDVMVIREAIQHYSMVDQWDKAENLALQLMSLDPENEEINITLGLIYENTGRYEEAVHYFQESIRSYQENSLIWYHLGRSFMGLEKYDEALLCFKTVNIIDPHDEIARISAENLLLRNYPINHEERNIAALWHFEKGSEQKGDYQFEKAFSEYRRGRLLSPLNLDGWWDYAGILDALEQPNRYRREVEALYRENYDNTDFLNLYELIMSSEDLSLMTDWKAPVVHRDSTVKLSLYVDSSQSELLHQGGEEDLLRYIGDSLMRNPRFEIREIKTIYSVSEAYRISRNGGSDFYILLTVSEMERSIRLHCEIYLSRTGVLTDSFDLLRSGNNRVSDILRKTSDNIETRLPIKGQLLSVDGDRVLVNLGFLNQVEPEMSFILLRKGGGRWLDKPPFMDYEADDVLGTVLVDKVQEELSSGILTRNSPFDLVNPGDEVYTLPENAEDQLMDPGRMNDELKTQLLHLY